MLRRPLGGNLERDAVLVAELPACGEIHGIVQLASHVRIVAHPVSRAGTRSIRGSAYAAAVRRLRSLSEAECYMRCYGGWDPTVILVKLEPRRQRYELRVTGEHLRREFEARIDARPDDETAAAA